MGSQLKTVAAYNDPVEAAMARNYLEAAGIQVLLLDEMTIATDWGLGNAIGGIKLQVHGWHLERAEMLLSRLDRERSEHPEKRDHPETGIATPETADELREEQEEESPRNLLVERAFRATVFGLLFWPLQFYALILLLSIPSTPGVIRPRNRWKVWACFLLSLPLISVAVLVITLVIHASSR
jgi:hypothetical protein